MRLVSTGAFSCFVLRNGKYYLSVMREDRFKHAMYSDIASGVLKKDWLPVATLVTGELFDEVANFIEIVSDGIQNRENFDVFEVELLAVDVTTKTQVKLLHEYEMQHRFRTVSTTKLGSKVYNLRTDIDSVVKDIETRHRVWLRFIDVKINVSSINNKTNDKWITKNTTPYLVRLRNIGFRGEQIVFYDAFYGF